MKQTTINAFLKGCITDIDEVLRTEDYWTFPTLNARILNKDGQGYIMTTMKGNTNLDATENIIGDQGEEFMISDGFVVLGSCEYNGILYIASLGPVLANGTREGELGCFPSCDWTSPAPVFQRVYRPLYNFDPTGTGTMDIFRSDLFDFDLENNIDMFARMDYDNSVNLYMCDHNNRNRVINVGFTQGGILNTRIYPGNANLNSFESHINQFPTTGQFRILNIGLDSIAAPGEFKCGNWFVYVRYMTHDYTQTDIVGESGPFQLYSGSSYDNYSPVTAQICTVEGGPSDKSSGKSLKIHLTNIDHTYKYVKIYLTRFYSTEDDVVKHENFEVLHDYEITGLNMDVTIHGTETMINIPDALLMKKYPDDIISKTHNHTGNRYFGGNWKKNVRHDQSLVDFAQQVTINWNTWGLYSPPYEDSSGGVKVFQHMPFHSTYKDYYNTYERVGYFRSEAYPFALIYEFWDGTLSDSYPTLGIDALTLNQALVVTQYNNYFAGVAAPYVNTEGIFRFPSNAVVNAKFSDGENAYIMYPEFDFNVAVTWANNNYDGDAEWLRSNVKAIHIVRGERNKNLIAQGYVFATSTPTGKDFQAHYTALNASYKHNIPRYFPINQCFPDDADDEDRCGLQESVNQWGVPYNDKKFVDNDPWRQEQSSDGNGYRHFYKLEHNFPLWKGFCPAHYWKKNATSSSNPGPKAIVNIAYMARNFMNPGHYAFYSFDYLHQQMFDIENIKYYKSQIRIMPGPDPVSALPSYWESQYEYNKSGLGGRGEPLLCPSVYMADLYNGTTFGSWKSDLGIEFGGDITEINSIGELKLVSPSTLIEAEGKFINLASEHDQSTQDTFWHISDDEGGADRANWHTNRSMYAAKYLSLYVNKLSMPLNRISNLDTMNWNEFVDTFNMDIGHSIVNLYKIDPTKIASDKMDMIYEPENILYYITHAPITFDELIQPGSTIRTQKVFRGDCFVQRSYFKQMYWNGSHFGASDDQKGYDLIGLDEAGIDNPDDMASGSSVEVWRNFAYFSHGLILGAVLECEHNVAMRHSGETVTFYPKSQDAFKFARLPYNATGVESLLLNKGYDRTLSVRSFIHYYKNLPSLITTNETRIRHTAEHVVGAFKDGYRECLESWYQDYDTKGGPINSIQENLGQLISVQDRCINEHYANEQQVKTPTNAGDLIVGTGPILAKQVRTLATFGSQHQWSVKKAGGGIYGVDWKERIVWSVKPTANQLTGATVNGAGDISKFKMISKWVYDLFDEYDAQTDIMNVLADSPATNVGIVTGYDPKFSEVYFTFLWPHKDGDKSRTLHWSEDLDYFIGETSFVPYHYASINNDFFSVYRNNQDTPSKYFHLHDVSDYDLWFYGVQYPWKFSIIVNGKQEGNDTSSITKDFNSHKMLNSEQAYARVLWKTEFQESDFDPFYDTARFWLTPEYLEHHWEFPIFFKTDATENDFQPESEMRGTWLKATFEYELSAPSYVKTIETVYTLSKV